MGQISEMEMASNTKGATIKDLNSPIQFYSMDCYFRQYWCDEQLSFKALKNTVNNLANNQLSLDVEMMETR